MNQYQRRLWRYTEYPFRPHDQLHLETILTIGNGLIGTRGTFEEGYPGDTATTFAAGIFNHHPSQIIPELVALPNWLTLRITLNGQMFRLDQGILLGYERTLDMQSAILTRGVLWRAPDGTIVQLRFERFASADNQHVLALRVRVKVLSAGTHQLTIESALDGTTAYTPDLTDSRKRVDHWAQLVGGAQADTLHLDGVTSQSGYGVSMAAHLRISGASVTYQDTSAPRVAAHQASMTVERHQEIEATKIIAVHTTRDSEQPDIAARSTLDLAVQAGWDVLYEAHRAVWTQRWHDFDVLIEGDEVAQRAIRFNLYHLLIATPMHDERVSIAAKTLSGYGYRGHVFWDTELFMLPPLTLVDPEASRRLLMYRYHNLAGARAKAAEAGYEGAMFPWESTDTGEETTPRWVGSVDEPIRVWTGDHEQHISSDIAYAVMQFWQWTGDDAWMRDYGAEIVLDTARFWGSRAEYNADADRYELRMQIGPDEYHENIDNSVFTNRLTRWHLESALAVWDWLQQHDTTHAAALQAQLDLTPQRLNHWRTVAEKLWIPMSDEGGGVFEQFEGFFDRLKPLNLSDYTPRTKNMDWILGHEATQRERVIKQADVVMLMALLGDSLGERAFLMRNWELYSQIVDHGSSLSPSVHAWVAARLGLIDAAYDLFIYSATVDIDDHKGNVTDGIHAASCGGTWQAIVFGFAGVHLTQDGVQVKPNLPAHWRRLRFTVRYQGQPIVIDLQGTQP